MMNALSEIVEISERDGQTFSAMRIYVSEMLDAINAVPASCAHCHGSREIHVPVHTPLQWEVDLWHNEGCIQAPPAKVERGPLRLVPDTGRGKGPS